MEDRKTLANHNQCFLALALLVLLMFAMAGCGEKNEYAGFPVITDLPVNTQGDAFLAGYSTQGRPINYVTLGTGNDVVLILSAMHGDEPAGVPLVFELMKALKADPNLLDGRRVVIVPVVNPDGLVRGTRYNSRGVDINRNFPADNRENNNINGHAGLSEKESVVLADLLAQVRPDRIVSIHQPYCLIDYDGPGKELAEAMGRQCDLPVNKLGGRPGSFGSYTGEKLGIPIITLELCETDHLLSADELWRLYGRAMLASVTYPD